MKQTLLWAATVCVLLIVPMSGAAPEGPRYTIRRVDLPAPFDGIADAAGVNALGQIAASAPAGGDKGFREHSFLWDGRARDLGTLGGDTCEAAALNDAGDVVGYSTLRPGRRTAHAFLWHAGKMRDLGTLGGRDSAATAINNRGQIVGTAQTRVGSAHAFLWQDGRMRDLGAGFAPWGINDRCQIVGDAGPWVALWQGGRLTKLFRGQAHAINARGQIVGSAGTINRYSFLQDGQKQTLLSRVGNNGSAALAVSADGEVVGYDFGMGEPPGFAWTWQGGIRRQLQDRIVPRSGWEVYIANGVNMAGQIVASGARPDARGSRASEPILLTPQP